MCMQQQKVLPVPHAIKLYQLLSSSCRVALQLSFALVGAAWLHWPVCAFTPLAALAANTAAVKGLVLAPFFSAFVCFPFPFPAIGCCQPMVVEFLISTPLTPP